MKNNYQSIFDIKKIETRIKETIVKNKKVYVNFESCNLRPTFGGQLFDKGKFYNGTWWNITEVVNIDNKIFCITNCCEKNLNLNETILLEIDSNRRHLISRMHSAIHLISYLNKHKMYTGYAGENKSRIDFIGDIEDFKLNFNDIQKIFKKIIKNKNAITVNFLNKSEIDFININEFIETNSNLYRIVEIKGYGLSMCNGTHVKNTYEIGDIKFGDPVLIKNNSYKLNVSII